MQTKTMIIGASVNPERYSYKAAEKLLNHGHEIYMIGARAGQLFDRPIETEQKNYSDVDTVTLYVSAKNQEPYVDYIIALKPRRVIFNPGTENPDLADRLADYGILTEEACTLVLLSTGAY